MTITKAVGVLKWLMVWFLITVVLIFFVIRVTTDWRNIESGVAPPADDFAARYFHHPAIAYFHIVPGVLYLLGACSQLFARIRNRHLAFHRRLGKWVLGLGLISGLMAMVVGVVMPFGGPLEGSASLLFGAYFVTALAIGYRAIRGLEESRHRRWMIRAFAVGLAVGTIRIWVGLFQALGVFSFQDSFGPAFWLAFLIHVTVAEWWLWRRPEPVVPPLRERHAS